MSSTVNHSPRIENRSMFLPIRYRQVDDVSESWQFLPPNAAASFYWEDLGRRHLFELLVDGNDPSKSVKYDIDKIGDHPPRSETEPTRPIRVTILKEDKKNIVRVSDYMPAIEPTSSISRRLPASSLSELSGNESQLSHLMSSVESEFHVIVELAELGISIIDHAPEEILYMSVQNLFVAYSTGLGSGLSRLVYHGLMVYRINQYNVKDDIFTTAVNLNRHTKLISNSISVVAVSMHTLIIYIVPHISDAEKDLL